MAPTKNPFELLPIFRERVWGRSSLEPFFQHEPKADNPTDNNRIGEVWFTFTENVTSLGLKLQDLLSEHPELLGNGADEQHPGICPILVKLLFTSERLSVQVHPNDEYAQEHHSCLGKTEAWYVLDSQPPGEVAVGFREPLTPKELTTAANSGEIERLLDWRKVQAGDVVFTPAGTVHAIGAGLTICEIQENSDITYRLYDYGRPRELHLEHGARVSHLGPHTHESTPIRLAEGRDELAACEYFHIERLTPKAQISFGGGLSHYAILICTKGSGTLFGQPCRAGQAWFVPADGEPFAANGANTEWILTYSSDEPIGNLSVD